MFARQTDRLEVDAGQETYGFQPIPADVDLAKIA
jgi:hypothetical protein